MSISPTVTEISRVSADFRTQLETCWGTDTAHSSTAFKTDPTASDGQCYVSSMAFAKHIKTAYPEINVEICRGQVELNSEVIIEDHGWVEIYLPRTTVLVDLTIDQASRAIPCPFINTTPALNLLGITHHVVDRRLLVQITNADVLARYAILEERLSLCSRE